MPPGGTNRHTDADEELVLGLRVDEAGNTRSSRAIAVLMRDQHHREIHYTTVARILKDQRQERQEVVRELIREKASPFVLADLDVFEHNLAIELEVLDQARPKVIVDSETSARTLDCPMAMKDYTALLREARETAHDRLKHASGTDKDEAADSTAAMLASFYGLDEDDGLPGARPSGAASPSEPGEPVTTDASGRAAT